MTLYANLYYRDYGKGMETFVGNLHDCREVCESAAAFELRIEPETRRLGVWRITPKERAE